MQISTNNSTTPQELTALHERGVHFVLCKDKIPTEKSWQLHSPSLESVLNHHAAGGQLGFIPGRSSMWVLDVDHFPNESKNLAGLLANVEALTIVNTKRGNHVYFKKPSRKTIANLKWSTTGFSGEFRGDNGHCVLWEPLTSWPSRWTSCPTRPPPSSSLFPRTTKGQANHQQGPS